MKAVKILVLLALVIAFADIVFVLFNKLQQRTVVDIIATNSVTKVTRREIVHHRQEPPLASTSTSPATPAESPVETLTNEIAPPLVEEKPIPPAPVEPLDKIFNTPVRRAPGVNEGVISGTVKLGGERPVPKTIKTDADPKCAELHAEEALMDETVVVGEAGGLRNVFVYVKAGLEGRTFPVPSEPVVMDQQGCRYEPHVFGMRTKQPLVIRNSDDTLHNIHAVPRLPDNKEFNLGQPNKGMEARKTFAVPEVMVQFKCDVHPWMSAYVGVLDHPYFAVTGDDGVFVLPPLPAGEYVIGVWHERFGEVTQPVTLSGHESRDLSFTFAPQ